MIEPFRHHRAHAPVPAVIFVEVPTGGSPKPVDARRPPPYQRNPWSPWRPATKPPNRKAEASVRLLRQIAENDAAAREFMAECRRRTA